MQSPRAVEGSEGLLNAREATFRAMNGRVDALGADLDPQLKVQRSAAEGLRWDFGSAVKAGEWSILLDRLEAGFESQEAMSPMLRRAFWSRSSHA